MLSVSLSPCGQPSSVARMSSVNGLPSPTHRPKQKLACRVSVPVRVVSMAGVRVRPGSDPLMLMIWMR